MNTPIIDLEELLDEVQDMIEEKSLSKEAMRNY